MPHARKLYIVEVNDLKEMITSFYKGDFTYERAKLLFSETDIEFSVSAGSIYNGHFTISKDANTKAKGVLASSCPLLKIVKKEFYGLNSRIEYNFDARFLEPNDTLNEHIKIISDCGEYLINVCINIVRPYFNSKIGKVMDLTRFTYLARYNWDQAVQIFTSKEFPDYILANDENYSFIRKYLLKSKSMNHALEEFLVAVNQKLPIKISISKSKLNYDMENEPIADKVIIAMENWGYIDIDISADSPFIKLERDSITSESFYGNSYFLEFIIDPSKMHKGNNYGRIYIKTTSETLVIEVKAAINDPIQKENIKSSIELKTYDISLVRNYIDYRLDNISKERYINKVNQIFSGIKELKDKEKASLVSDYSVLFLVQLSILNYQEEKGKRLIDKLEPQSRQWKQNNPSLYWAFMALKAVYSKEGESKKIINTMEKHYFGQGRDNWNLLLYLMYLDSKYKEDRILSLNEIKNHFSHDVSSPYLYLEALKIFNDDPRCLVKLSQFEIQIIHFGIKVNAVSRELANQYVYLAGKLKQYNQLVFEDLAQLYGQYPSIEVLNAICSLLIKGNKRSNKYFPWFNIGVSANLRIAELYEYFMYSIDEEKDQVLPQNLLYYFAYSRTLNVEKTSYLYAYVINNKDNIPETYKTYLPIIEKFAKEQLKLGVINTGLSVIYKGLLLNNNIGDDSKILLWNVVFRYDIECDNPNIKGVIVAHREFEKESYTPLNKGQVQIDVYNSSGEIFFMDSNDNLYYSELKQTKKPLLDMAASNLDKLTVSDHSPISLVYTAKNIQKDKLNSNKEVKLTGQTLALTNISREFYEQNLLAIISYYNNKVNINNQELLILDKYLMMLDYIPKKCEDKYKYIDLLIDRKFYDKAYKEISKYGYEGVDEGRLYILSTQLIKDSLSKEQEDDTLLALSYYCLTKGKHNQYILKYLTDYYQGNLEDLYEIIKVSETYNLDSRKLDIKFLTQVLFTQSRPAESYNIYKSFTRKGIKSILAKAFINYQAYEYLVRDYEIDERFFESMELLVKTEKNDYCILALLKHYARQESLQENQIKFVHRFLEEYIKKGIVLAFFKKFKNYILMPYDFIHQTFVDVKGDSNSKVTISYKYFDEDEPLEEYSLTSIEMDRVFSGIFTSKFLLFYNQSIKYSIVIEDYQGNAHKSEEKILQSDQESELYEENLYNQINLMKIAKDSEDKDRFIDSFDKIQKSDYIINKVFKPL